MLNHLGIKQFLEEEKATLETQFNELVHRRETLLASVNQVSEEMLRLQGEFRHRTKLLKRLEAAKAEEEIAT